MKEYCVDLELAKELKENGFPQDSEFYWNLHKAGGSAFPLDDNLNKKLASYKEKIGIDGVCYATYSAPTSDELLKELPKEINDYILEIVRYEDGTIEADYCRNLWRSEDTEYLIQSKKLFYKLSNALGILWLDLKKEGHIK